MTKKTLDNEDVATLRSNEERRPPVFPLDIDLDVVPLEELGHHHPQPLVGRHAQRGLAELIELVGILTNCRKLVDHVCVPDGGLKVFNTLYI